MKQKKAPKAERDLEIWQDKKGNFYMKGKDGHIREGERRIPGLRQMEDNPTPIQKVHPDTLQKPIALIPTTYYYNKVG